MEAVFWGRGGIWGFGYKETGSQWSLLVVGDADSSVIGQAGLLVTKGELAWQGQPKGARVEGVAPRSPKGLCHSGPRLPWSCSC